MYLTVKIPRSTFSMTYCFLYCAYGKVKEHGNRREQEMKTGMR